jgi:L-lactate dehydrogenase (cytochrome)
VSCFSRHAKLTPSAHAPLQTLRDINTHANYLLGRDDFQILLDGGIRRGTDVLKALALGARGVGLGRPFIYAATCWGPDGVRKAVNGTLLRDVPLMCSSA